MADGQTADGGAQQVEGGEPQGTAEPDYKALYEAEKEAKEKAIAESRKWEGRSKANKVASAKAEKTAEERIADLESKLSEKERAEEPAATVDKPGTFAPGSAPKRDFIREEFMKHRR